MERALAVLDGAVLVVSAVEGVQAQTRILWRALERLRIPTIFFVNKVDRVGADRERVCDELRRRLTSAIARMDGDAVVESVADVDDDVLADYVEGRAIEPSRLRSALARQTSVDRLHPVFCGSALTGAGVPELAAGIRDLLPHDAGDDEAPLACTVFKIERGKHGEKIAYARLFAGTIAARDVVLGEKVTEVAVGERRRPATAGEIARLRGLANVRIGDSVGTTTPNA